MRARYETIDFLRAVALYPAFCGEHNEASELFNLEDSEKACKRELATLMAHIVFETGIVD